MQTRNRSDRRITERRYHVSTRAALLDASTDLLESFLDQKHGKGWTHTDIARSRRGEVGSRKRKSSPRHQMSAHHDGICGNEVHLDSGRCTEMHICELDEGHADREGEEEHECACGKTWKEPAHLWIHLWNTRSGVTRG